MKKNKLKTATIDFGLLPGYAFVSIGATVKQVLEKQKDKEWVNYFKSLENNTNFNFCNKTEINGTTFFSLFIENKKGEEWYATLAHEVFHLCQFLCNTYYIDMVQEKEMVAYLHTHLMTQIIKLKNQ